jgi:hypothetical protein
MHIFQFQVGDVCVFSSKFNGYKGNDGKKSRISRLKLSSEWGNNQNIPEYVIEFMDGNTFGVREDELTPT